MDSLEAVVYMTRPGCFMASVDLKDAYYTVPIHTSHQKYLKFCFDGVFYKYTCLPNGLASALHIFTKILKPVYATLRSMGHLNLSSHKLTFLGYVLDSIAMTVTLTGEKVQRILSVGYPLKNTNAHNYTGSRGYRYSGVQFSWCSVWTTSLPPL